MAPLEGAGDTMGDVPAGQVLPGNAAELKDLANKAARDGDDKKATRLYTMAIDVLGKGLAKDMHGRAQEHELVALNHSSAGLLAKLLSNRSLTQLRLGDLAAALEDAETCTLADPIFEKGHLRFLTALEAVGASLTHQLEVCEQAVEKCPGSEVLVARKWKLKKAVASLPSEVRAHEGDVSREADDAALVERTRRLADDPSDHRRAMAAADLGSLLATGARGVEKDVQEAERYLRIGADGGDLGAQRNLGFLLLELQRPADAAEQLGEAARAGDETAAAAWGRLVDEAAATEREARARLQALAEAGDPRARAALQELATA